MRELIKESGHIRGVMAEDTETGEALRVTGRRKDLVIVRGRNYLPSEFEWEVAARTLWDCDGAPEGHFVESGRLHPAPAEPLVPPPPPQPVYFIPGCYLGNVPPRDARLPATA